MPTRNDFVQDPHSYFHWARAQAPVLWTELASLEGWLVTGFQEAEAVLKDPRFIKDRLKLLPPDQQPEMPEAIRPAFQTAYGMILFRDAPDHTRIRALVVKAFTATIVARLRPTVEAICGELADQCVGREEHELIRDFAHPLPVRVIAELLGLPPRDSLRFRHWSEQFVRIADLNPSPQDWAEVAPLILEFKRYLEDQMAEKRAHPQADLLSGLVAASEQGDKLTPDEVVSTCMLLLIAGHETTTNLIANGYYWLLRHPEQHERLRNDHSLIPTAIEEMLRYEPPAPLTTRSAGEDLEFAGCPMQRGQIVMIALGGANRDPRVVPQPDVFDIARSPNRHLSFSAGAHFCLGAALARLEAEAALRTLLTRFRRPALMEEPPWRTSMIIRGFERLKLRAEVV